MTTRAWPRAIIGWAAAFMTRRRAGKELWKVDGAVPKACLRPHIWFSPHFGRAHFESPT